MSTQNMNFGGTINTAGVNPAGGVVWNKQRTELYGTTMRGGQFDCGTIFSTSLNGHKTLHSFNRQRGAEPFGTLIYDLDTSTLYGTTVAGGRHNKGTIFSFNIQDKRFRVIHSFNGTDGYEILCSLTLVNHTLFGCSTYGGLYQNGNVFSVLTNGKGFKILHSFSGFDGSGSFSSVVLKGFTLYGTTIAGGTNDCGTIFSICTNGTGFKTLASFKFIDGMFPSGNLLVDNNMLYGCFLFSSQDKITNGGVYSFDLSSNKLTVLHTLTLDEGAFPFCGLVINNGILYGTTISGGIQNNGTIFSVRISDKQFNLLYTFTGGYDGSTPVGSLIFDSNKMKLYGTANIGGIGEAGSVFAFDIAGNEIMSFPFTGISHVQLSKLDKQNKSNSLIKLMPEQIQKMIKDVDHPDK